MIMDVGSPPLTERVRALLPDDHTLREVEMFGGRSFLLDDRILAAAGRHGDLLVGIDPVRRAELLGVPGARAAVMGAGRPMGPGWIRVAVDGLASKKRLAFWLQVALERHAAQAGPLS